VLASAGRGSGRWARITTECAAERNRSLCNTVRPGERDVKMVSTVQKCVFGGLEMFDRPMLDT